ncbi:MAG TPA: tetratricopeptide repeat protein [Candidatus Hydrogenedens sp.]|nr:tetratricopeptide repeat protein [Candidatus Hydrogenedens sp.]
MKIEIASWLYCMFNPCSYYEKLIVSVCCDEISDEELSELQKHIESCKKCKEKYDDILLFSQKINQVKDVLYSTEILEDINVIPYIRDKVSKEKGKKTPLIQPKLQIAYSLGAISLVLIYAFVNIFILQKQDKVGNNSASFTSLSSPEQGIVTTYDGPLENQKDKLREFIKNNNGQSIAGQALLLLADLEYTSSEHYDEAYRLYSQLRSNYPNIFSSSPEAVYRYNLLDEIKKDKFKPLYELNSSLANNDNSIKQLEKIVANYPGTMVANLAVSYMIDCISNSSNLNNPEQTIKALEDLKGHLTEPIAIAQVNYVLGNIYWNQKKDYEKAKTSFQYVVNSESKQLSPLANEALMRLVHLP